tara:strand:+ start:912 stop:1961 length:1050 start_codon:yes stop_codon:yes gene_type:complete
MNNILITGGCGFIGSNFIRYMVNNNKNVHIINLDKLTYAGNKKNLVGLNNDSYTLIEGDICDSLLVKSIINDYKVDSLINFAAESHVDRSISNPTNFLRTNVMGTLNLLVQAKEYLKSYRRSSFKFIQISTDEVYGSLGDNGCFDENTPYDPRSPYSASKASSDHLVRSWFHTYKLPTIITNCSNNYGPYQFPEKLIPLMIINCFKKKKLPIYGSGINIRDWLHVDDHCSAINTVLLKGNPGETYCIGGDAEKTTINIVNIICDIMDKFKPLSDQGEHYSSLISYVEDRPGHDHRYAIDFKKINSNLGWEPQISFERGIEDTIKWYLNNQSWWEDILKNNYNQERLGLL